MTRKNDEVVSCYNERCYLKEKCLRWQSRKTTQFTRLYPQAGAYCSFYIEGENRGTE